MQLGFSAKNARFFQGKLITQSSTSRSQGHQIHHRFAVFAVASGCVPQVPVVHAVHFLALLGITPGLPGGAMQGAWRIVS